MASLQEHYQFSRTLEDFGIKSTNRYYPIGNSYPSDVTHGCKVPLQCDTLLLGCGDVRHVLYTLSEIHDRNVATPGQVVNFHLNDKESGVLARDLVLLYLIKTIDPENNDDCKFVWAVWHDALLTEEHADRLHTALDVLSSHKSGDWNVNFGNASTEDALKSCIDSWRQDRTTAPTLTEKRLDFLKSINVHHAYFPDVPVERVASRIYMQHQMFAQDLYKNRLFQEVKNYIQTGLSSVCTLQPLNRQALSDFYANVTLIRPGQLEWSSPDDSCYFMSWNVDDKLEKYDGYQHTVASLCLEKLQTWIRSVREQCEKGYQLQIYLWMDDAINLCDTSLPTDLKFDFIHTSNLADQLGLIPLVVFCQEKLKENGLLSTESYEWIKMTDDVTNILRKCIDISPLMYPTILGVHLAEETVLGHENLPEEGAFVGCGNLSLRWKKARNNSQLDVVGTADAISTFLEELGTNKYNVEKSADYLHHKNISVVRFDERTRNKLKTRLNNMISPPAQDSLGISEKVIEFNDRYEVYIMPGDEGLKQKWRCWHGEFDCNTVTFAADGSGNRNLNFSCTVTLNLKKIRTSKQLGFVHITLFKDTELNDGERVLPWKKLDQGEVENLQNYPTTKFWLKNLNSYIRIAYPMDGFPLAIDVPFPERRHQLKDLFELFLKSVPITEKVQVLYAPKTNVVKNPLVDFYAAFRVDGFKLWENKPTLFVTWFRFDKASELLQQGKLKNIDLKELGYTAQNLRIIPHLTKLMQGYELFTSILEVNSYRLVQPEQENKRWKVRTFIRGRYPFQLLKAYENNIRLQNLTGHFAPKFDSGQRHLILGLHALGLDKLSWSSEEAREALLAAGNRPSCDSCGERSPECKRCSACKSVFYSDRVCQLAAWPKHKKQCKIIQRKI